MITIKTTRDRKYTVTFDGCHILCNGHVTCFSPTAAPGLAYVVETGDLGANGKRNVIGITAAEYAIYRQAVADKMAAQEAETATPRAQDRAAHPDYFGALDDLVAKANAHDRAYNEGVRHGGANPYRVRIAELDRRHGRVSGEA